MPSDNALLGCKQLIYMPALTLRQTKPLIDEILLIREQEKLSATETCNQFLAMGLVPPAYLVIEYELDRDIEAFSDGDKNALGIALYKRLRDISDLIQRHNLSVELAPSMSN